MNQDYIFEPINFIFSNNFFEGIKKTNLITEKAVIILSQNEAEQFAFEQNLPEQYEIWQDILSNYRALLSKQESFDFAYNLLNNYLIDIENRYLPAMSLEYRKKKLKKLNNKYDDFFFSDARDDAVSTLLFVSINRYLDTSLDANIFFETIFELYQLGGWVCGMTKKKDFLLFDPNVLKK